MIEYVESLFRIKRYSINGFCDGWKKPLDRNELLKVIKNSTYKIIAIDNTNKKIVGIITALSDQTNWAFIPYLEVIPEYQQKGIGKTLMESMLKKLDKINCIDLTCDIEMQDFYKKFKMLESNGMVIRKYS